MKKILSSVLLTMLVSTAAYAGGFTGKTAKVSIQEALKLPDDSYVTVQGNIVKRLSSEKYLFKDASGTITVEIDDDKWGAVVAGEADKLELTGEVERKLNSVHLDVDTVKKINK